MHNEIVKWEFKIVQDNPNCAKTAGRLKYMPVPITPLLCERPQNTNTNKLFLRQQAMRHGTYAKLKRDLRME